MNAWRRGQRVRELLAQADPLPTNVAFPAGPELALPPAFAARERERSPIETDKENSNTDAAALTAMKAQQESMQRQMFEMSTMLSANLQQTPLLDANAQVAGGRADARAASTPRWAPEERVRADWSPRGSMPTAAAGDQGATHPQAGDRRGSVPSTVDGQHWLAVAEANDQELGAAEQQLAAERRSKEVLQMALQELRSGGCAAVDLAGVERQAELEGHLEEVEAELVAERASLLAAREEGAHSLNRVGSLEQAAAGAHTLLGDAGAC